MPQSIWAISRRWWCAFGSAETPAGATRVSRVARVRFMAYISAGRPRARYQRERLKREDGACRFYRP